ncbi:MAG: hypothetical protein NTY14_03410 [Candidatus Omnitrophica bacterium]|nr:hypothetical protein [Candidatus Omnitrophota bacterium]
MIKKFLILIDFLIISFFAAGLPGPAQAETDGKLSQVKVAVLYENITDGVSLERSPAATIKLLRETRADMIFRGFWKWEPIVESPEDIPDELFEFTQSKGLTRRQAVERVRQTGHYYRSLASWIAAIKKEMPDIIFCVAIPAQQLCRVELNPMTGKVYTAEETWAMALDPQRWDLTRKGKPVTKEQFQARVSGMKPGKNGAEYDRRKASAYFPDITNADFRELLLSWAKKQIDCGADAVWIDMLYAQAKLIARATGDSGHPAIKEALAAAAKIVDGIHKYGESKGKYIYVGSWGQSKGEFGADNNFGGLDFVTFAPSKEEIRNNGLDKEKWQGRISDVRSIHGNIPVFSFIDWSNNDSQTVTFSQELNSREQAQVLKTFDASFSQLGINFIYPLYGGYMGNLATKLSFGKSRVYDSLAPEFQTYETIKELARIKAQK